LGSPGTAVVPGADYLMKKASADVLGFPLKTEIKLFPYPHFYVESEGKPF